MKQQNVTSTHLPPYAYDWPHLPPYLSFLFICYIIVDMPSFPFFCLHLRSMSSYAFTYSHFPLYAFMSSFPFICLRLPPNASLYASVCVQLHFLSFVYICLQLPSYAYIFVHMLHFHPFVYICLHMPSCAFICLYVFNSSKYQAMVLGKNKGAELAFKCDESQIPMSKTMELLGVTIDDKLNFENHIAKICRKVSQQIAVLKRMQKLLPFETRRDLYKLSYCRTLITVPKRGTPYEELLKRIGLPSLREQRLAKILSTIFKILASDAGPASLRDFITVRHSTYNLRGNTIVDLPK